VDSVPLDSRVEEIGRGFIRVEQVWLLLHIEGQEKQRPVARYVVIIGEEHPSIV
jgi:hypothetical protein